LPLPGQVDLPTLFRDEAMRNLAFLLLMFCLPSLAMADPPGKNWAELANRMSGGYTVIGRRPDSNATFSGRLTFHARGKKLAFVRTIDGETVRGSAFFDTLPDCDGSVLRLRFFQNGQLYEGLFIWSADCNSTFAFSGSIHSKNTKKPGLETFFPDS
jgi:hypothetical protein